MAQGVVRQQAPRLVASSEGLRVRDGGVQVGQLVGLDEAGVPLVTAPSVGLTVPVPARSTVARPVGWDGRAALTVLLHFEGDALDRPIVTGIVQDRFEPAEQGRPLVDQTLQVAGVTMDGKRLELSASQEVVLRCGQGSITLQADGRVVIKGTELVSRASGANKIRGATVAIN